MIPKTPMAGQNRSPVGNMVPLGCVSGRPIAGRGSRQAVQVSLTRLGGSRTLAVSWIYSGIPSNSGEELGPSEVTSVFTLPAP